MPTTVVATQRHFHGRLARHISIHFILLSIVLLGLMGGFAFLRTRMLLHDQAIDFLNLTLFSESHNLQEQLHTSYVILAQAAENQAFTGPLKAGFHAPSSNDPANQSARQILSEQLQSLFSANQVFSQLLLTGPDGQVLLATHPEWEGKVLPTELFHKGGKTRAVFGLEPGNPKTLVFLSVVPLLYEDGSKPGNLLGVGAPVLRAGTASQSSKFTTSTYLITSNSQFVRLNNNDPGSTRTWQAFQPSAGQVDTIWAGLNQGERSGVVELVNAQAEPVIAAYRWLPDLEIGWVTEIPQAEVYDYFNSLLVLIAGSLLIVVFILGIALWASAYRMMKPLEEISEAFQRLAHGSREARFAVRRSDEIGMLASSFNTIAETFDRMGTSLEQKVRAGVNQFRISAELAQAAISSSSLDELLPRILKIIATQFDFLYVSAYLLDDGSKVAVLRYSIGPLASEMKNCGTRVPVNSPTLTGWVTANHTARVDRIPDVEGNPRREEIHPGAAAEAGIPIGIGGQVLGMLHIQVINPDQLKGPVITDLQHLANQIAPAIHSLQMMAFTQVSLEETTLLYQASYKIAQAESAENILEVTTQALEQTPYHAILLLLEEGKPQLALTALQAPCYLEGFESPESLSQPVMDAAFLNSHVMVSDLNNSPHLPEGLVMLARRANPERAAFLPVVRAGQVTALLVLGMKQTGASWIGNLLTPAALQPYSNLLELVITSLEKVHALHSFRKQLVELQTLQAVSQAISQETDLNSLYALIHRQVTQVVGEVSFLIALYNPKNGMISLPYMIETGQLMSTDPFPLGEGLTSILIHTRRPLMLVENAEEKLRELGAKIVGRPARSWLGVPLMIGGEAIGAMIIQDVEQENRFDQDDLRLMTTLSSQIAVVIRNANLLELARRQAERERQLFEITSKIHRSTDIPSILRTTTEEISHALGARRAHVQLRVQTALTEQASAGEAPVTEQAAPPEQRTVQEGETP